MHNSKVGIGSMRRDQWNRKAGKQVFSKYDSNAALRSTGVVLGNGTPDAFSFSRGYYRVYFDVNNLTVTSSANDFSITCRLSLNTRVA